MKTVKNITPNLTIFVIALLLTGILVTLSLKDVFQEFKANIYEVIFGPAKTEQAVIVRFWIDLIIALGLLGFSWWFALVYMKCKYLFVESPPEDLPTLSKTVLAACVTGILFTIGLLFFEKAQDRLTVHIMRIIYYFFF